MIKVDWKLAGGFSALLLLIVAIGAIGMIQIQSLSKTVDALGRRYFPMQKAALEMRVNNSLYAMGIRNYIFWRSAKYLEAARTAANKEAINSAVAAFDVQLKNYSEFAHALYQDTPSVISLTDQEQWIGNIQGSQQELRSIGDRILELVDQIDSAEITKKRELEDAVNKLLMAFESKLYIIDGFIDGNVQKATLEAVRAQLVEAEAARKRAITYLVWSLVLGLGIGSETAFLVYRDRRREREHREKLVREMIRIEEEERKSLSLQVHDQMGQDLSGLRIYLDLINKHLPDTDDDAKKSIQEGKKILSGLIEKSHNIAEMLRPPALEEIGLVDTIESLILHYRQLSGIHILYEKPDQVIKLPGEYSLLLYRVAQEGLTNILNHAQAQYVEVRLEMDRAKVHLLLQDDGVGFAYEDFVRQPHRRLDDRLKMGLVGLRERVEILGGSMEVKSAPNRGTQLCVELPAKKA
ncbi:MAG: ATP-binding protein [Candidatus Omnitrophota bacterium]